MPAPRNPSLAYDSSPFPGMAPRDGMPFTYTSIRRVPGVQTVKDHLMTTTAFDAAIRAATARGTDRAVRAMTALREAERDVAPYVGTLPAMDTAPDVYRVALEKMGIDLNGVAPEAYGGLFKALRKNNPGRLREAVRVPAMDAAAGRRYAERFPDAGRLASGFG